MNIEILADADAVARKGAATIAEEARLAVSTRGRFTFAVSGGHTPWLMLRALVDEDVPWQSVHVVQVDERVAPAGDPDRNLTHVRECLLEHVPPPPEHVYPMPVEAPNLESAAVQYALTLQKVAGSPPIFDLVHLGLGPDGHTASLVPGDPVLDIADTDVAHHWGLPGKTAMTLTYPIINRAQRILWLVTGGEKVAMFKRLCAGDASIPAGRVRQDSAMAVADRAAAQPDMISS